jgi:hypothetical protein
MQPSSLIPTTLKPRARADVPNKLHPKGVCNRMITFSAAVYGRGPSSTHDLYLMTKKQLGGTIEEAFLMWLLECFQVIPDRRHPSLLLARMEAAPLFPREPSPDPDASFTRRMVLGWFACDRRPVHA